MRVGRTSYLAGFTILVLGAMLSGAGAPADLHLALSKAEPAVDSSVTTAPTEISLFFTQAPQSGSTSIRLINSSDQEVALGEAKADADDTTIVRAPVTAPLPSGAYQVAWRTMAADGHVVRGDFRFTYRPDS